MVNILEDTVFIGEDDNSGGSEAGLDAEETYDLTVCWRISSRTPSRVGT